MKRTLLVGATLVALSACGDTPLEPRDPGLVPPSAAAKAGPRAPALTDLEQALLAEYQSGADMGAVLDRSEGCALLTGFNNQDGMVAFGGLFPGEPCGNGNFARTNPDGSTDLHLKGSGGFFLVITAPPGGFFGSGGSDVRWRRVWHEDGASTFNVSGTLSNGSRVRAHFTTTPGGKNPPGNTLWIEGIGYLVGGR